MRAIFQELTEGGRPKLSPNNALAKKMFTESNEQKKVSNIQHSRRCVSLALAYFNPSLAWRGLPRYCFFLRQNDTRKSCWRFFTTVPRQMKALVTHSVATNCWLNIQFRPFEMFPFRSVFSASLAETQFPHIFPLEKCFSALDFFPFWSHTQIEKIRLKKDGRNLCVGQGH